MTQETKSNTILSHEEPKQQTLDLASLIEQIQKNPELANTLAALIANGSKVTS